MCFYQEGLIVEGCLDINYTEYNSEATQDDGSCSTAVILGCTDENSITYDPIANTNNGNCEAIIEGCTDVAASNYDVNPIGAPANKSVNKDPPRAHIFIILV